MKATGIIKRIDDLGRVVIPKEVRRTMKIREGDALEIFTSPNGVTFQKYSYARDQAKMIEKILRTSSLCLAFADCDKVIACANISKSSIINKPITDTLYENLQVKSPIENICAVHNYHNASIAISVRVMGEKAGALLCFSEATSEAKTEVINLTKIIAALLEVD